MKVTIKNSIIENLEILKNTLQSWRAEVNDLKNNYRELKKHTEQIIKNIITNIIADNKQLYAAKLKDKINKTNIKTESKYERLTIEGYITIYKQKLEEQWIGKNPNG